LHSQKIRRHRKGTESQSSIHQTLLFSLQVNVEEYQGEIVIEEECQVSTVGWFTSTTVP